jgi:hypothetical protein
LHAPHAFDGLAQALVEIAQPLSLVASAARIDVHQHCAVAPDADVGIAQVLQRAHEEAGADQQ